MSNYYGNNSHVFMTCNDWENTRRTMAQHHYKDVQTQWRRRADYFRRQRFFGCVLFIVGTIMILVGHFARIPFLGYLGLAAGTLGLYMIVAKHMILVDEYYQECQARMNLI